MGFIKKYADGSDITIMNTYYLRPKKNDVTNKWSKDSLTIIYKDNKTGEKHFETIYNPDYEFYVAKPEHRVDYNRIFIEEENVDTINVSYRGLEKKIAEITNNLDFYNNNINSGNRRANVVLHEHTDIFNSDMHIEDHYRYRFSKLYLNSINDTTKAYIDIEVDAIDAKGDFPEMGECPINAISFLNEYNNTSYTLLLRDKDNPLIAEFEEEVKNTEDLRDIFHPYVVETVGGYKESVRFKLDDLKYKVNFYDDEIQLIHDLFRIVNITKPDFIMAWNMGFDLPYMIERIKVLGYNPEDIICHPDFKEKVARYWIDDRNKNELAERGDFATIASYSTWLDLMIHFASRRKGQHVFPKFKLDYIGEKVAKVKKYDFKDVAANVVELPRKNFKVFTIYNIIDNIVQKCINHKTGDIDYIYSKCIINNTRYQKGHRNTVYLTNKGTGEFLSEDGLIIGNNANRRNQKAEKFPGAFVSDPNKMNDYSKMTIMGIPINLLNNLIDLDYSSLYPSILREFNMAPNTQIGKLIIANMIWEKENRRNDPSYNRGSEFIENLHSKDYLTFCHRWLGLRNYKGLMEDIVTYYSDKIGPVVATRGKNKVIIPAKVIKEDSVIIPARIGNFIPAQIVKQYDKEEFMEVITNGRTYNNLPYTKQRYTYGDRFIVSDEITESVS